MESFALNPDFLKRLLNKFQLSCKEWKRKPLDTGWIGIDEYKIS